jgi:hypothetical protein
MYFLFSSRHFYTTIFFLYGDIIMRSKLQEGGADAEAYLIPVPLA